MVEILKKILKLIYCKKEIVRIKSRIDVVEAEWDKLTHTDFKLKSKYIIPESGNCHLFIDASILPTSHTYASSKERLLLLDTILNEDYEIWEELLQENFWSVLIKNFGFLFFPYLITKLCMKQGVPINGNE